MGGKLRIGDIARFRHKNCSVHGITGGFSKIRIIGQLDGKVFAGIQKRHFLFNPGDIQFFVLNPQVVQTGHDIFKIFIVGGFYHQTTGINVICQRPARLLSPGIRTS